jgi:hypothetical protein
MPARILADPRMRRCEALILGEGAPVADAELGCCSPRSSVFALAAERKPARSAQASRS